MLLLKDIIQDIGIVEGKISGVDAFIVQLSSIGGEFLSKEEGSGLTEIKFEMNGYNILFRFKLIGGIYLQKLMIKEVEGEEVKVDFSDIHQLNNK